MRASSMSKPALVAAFALGVLGGALLSVAMGWIGPSDPAANLAVEHASADVQERRKIEELQRELAAARTETETVRRSVGEEVRAKGSGAAERGIRVKPSEVGARLEQELARLIASADLGAQFRGEEDKLFVFLVESWLANDRPEAALALLQAFDEVFDVGVHAIRTGQALRKAKHTALAIEAYLLALERQTTEAAYALEDLAPERGLRALDALGDKVKHDWAARSARIRFLMALGRQDEAIATLDEGLGNVSMNTWHVLIERAPEAAESRIRRRLAQGGMLPSVQRELELYLIDSIAAQGRRDEAIARLEKGLSSVLTSEWVEKLGELSRARALSFLERQTKERPGDAKALGLLGAQLLAAKRRAEAFDVLRRSYTLEKDGDVAERMLEANPIRATQLLEDRARSARDDELIGDIADAMWKLGQRQRAATLWEEARRFDPDDSEWTRKIRAIAERRDPLR